MLVRAKKATDAAEEIFYIKCSMVDLLKCGIEIVKEKVKLMYSKCVRVCVCAFAYKGCKTITACRSKSKSG